jgi:hypothetical protein
VHLIGRKVLLINNQDRLTNFNDNLGNNSQTYDNRGRIQNNSQLGNYSYDGASYKQVELDSSNNETAKAYYQQDQALQQVNYNVFKSPVEIIEQGKERISFQYNGSLGRSYMNFGDEQSDKLNRRFPRHYSEMEVWKLSMTCKLTKTALFFICRVMLIVRRPFGKKCTRRVKVAKPVKTYTICTVTI